MVSWWSMSRKINLDAVPELVAAANRVGVPLDGHTIGMIGVAHAARLLDLTLVRASTQGHDALTQDGRTVEVKATTRSTVALQTIGRKPELLAVLRLDPDTLEPSGRLLRSGRTSVGHRRKTTEERTAPGITVKASG